VRKHVFAVAACLATMAFAAPAASAAPSFGGCQLQGTASFSPGLGANSQPFSYGFSGNLTGCQSTQAGAPTSGTVSAGQTLTEQVTNSVTKATDTVTYQEPVPTGSGGCATSTTSGQSLATWADGSTTVVAYTTSGAAAAVKLSGSVAPSMTLSAINPPAGDPTTYTINSTRYAGQSAGGLLTFQPADPTACNTPTGVTSAAIGGGISLYTTS
jgi:hypothetical protein